MQSLPLPLELFSILVKCYFRRSRVLSLPLPHLEQAPRRSPFVLEMALLADVVSDHVAFSGAEFVSGKDFDAHLAPRLLLDPQLF